MKAVCTILGWWTAAAAAAGGAGMELAFEFDGCSAAFVLALPVALGAEDAAGAGVDEGCAEPLAAAPFWFAPSPALELESCTLADLVGEPTSMGSVGDGADIWILGVGMGTTRVEAGSSAPSSADRFRWEGSVAAAMDTVERMPLVGGRESVRVAMSSSLPTALSRRRSPSILLSLYVQC